jgi:hypothetical protein
MPESAEGSKCGILTFYSPFALSGIRSCPKILSVSARMSGGRGEDEEFLPRHDSKCRDSPWKSVEIPVLSYLKHFSQITT